MHNCLLRADIPQLQVLTNLRGLAEGEWYVAAFPLKLVGGAGAPVRVCAIRGGGSAAGPH